MPCTRSCIARRSTSTSGSVVRTDPRAAIAEFALTDDERSAFLAGDVASLARGGVHTFLLSRLPRFGLLGLDRDEYNRRMRSLR